MNYRDIKIGTNKILRHFTKFTQNDFVWHRDKENRMITVESGDNFQLQFENELPFVLQKHNEYFIPKETYHRVVIGSDKLVVKIRKI